MCGVEQFALFDVDGAEEDLCEPLSQQRGGLVCWNLTGGVLLGAYGVIVILKGAESGAEKEQSKVMVDL